MLICASEGSHWHGRKFASGQAVHVWFVSARVCFACVGVFYQVPRCVAAGRSVDAVLFFSYSGCCWLARLVGMAQCSDLTHLCN